MKRSVLSVFLLFGGFLNAHALWCYECKGNERSCARDKLDADLGEYSRECSSSYNKCYRLWYKKIDVSAVDMGCGTQDDCNKEQEECERAMNVQCSMHCCETDKCNFSSAESLSVVLGTIFMCVGLALLNQNEDLL